MTIDEIKDDETRNIDDKSEDFYNFCKNLIIFITLILPDPH